jgi:hypothetical protein
MTLPPSAHMILVSPPLQLGFPLNLCYTRTFVGMDFIHFYPPSTPHGTRLSTAFDVSTASGDGNRLMAPESGNKPVERLQDHNLIKLSTHDFSALKCVS